MAAWPAGRLGVALPASGATDPSKTVNSLHVLVAVPKGVPTGHWCARMFCDTEPNKVSLGRLF